jgi:hypothetical protein
MIYLKGDHPWFVRPGYPIAVLRKHKTAEGQALREALANDPNYEPRLIFLEEKDA